MNVSDTNCGHSDVETDENVRRVRIVETFRYRSSHVHERMEKLTKVSGILFEAHDDTIASQLLLGHLQKIANAFTQVHVLVRSSDDEEGPGAHGRVLKNGSGPGKTELRERNGLAGKTMDRRRAGEYGSQDGRLRGRRKVEAVLGVIRLRRGQERLDGSWRRDGEAGRRVVG